MTDLVTAPCPARAHVVPPAAVPVARPTEHGGCCYWDHLTARWVPVTADES